LEAAVKSGERQAAVIACLLVLMAVGARLLPHPANFAPVMAVALFGGAVLPRRLAVTVPVAAMLLSDLIIGFYDYRVMVVVWGCYAVIALAGSRWLHRSSIVRGALLTISASLFFFLVTNFAVWLSSGMYAHSWRGLADCYILALPFFRNTFLSDLLYVTVLFGLYAAGRIVIDRLLVHPLLHKPQA
jgi:hypothetical protein